MGATGGSADAVVVSHNHKVYAYAYAEISGQVGGVSVTSDVQELYKNTNTVGESGIGKNLPPYLAVNIWKRTA